LKLRLVSWSCWRMRDHFGVETAQFSRNSGDWCVSSLYRFGHRVAAGRAVSPPVRLLSAVSPLAVGWVVPVARQCFCQDSSVGRYCETVCVSFVSCVSPFCLWLFFVCSRFEFLGLLSAVNFNMMLQLCIFCAHIVFRFFQRHAIKFFFFLFLPSFFFRFSLDYFSGPLVFDLCTEPFCLIWLLTQLKFVCYFLCLPVLFYNKINCVTII